MYKGVIFTLGTTTAERELNAIKEGRSRLSQYFDSLTDVEPIDGYELRRSPIGVSNPRTINMRPYEGRNGQNYILIVPTRGGAVKFNDGGSVVNRQGYFEMADNIIGVGMCRLNSRDYEHGDLIFPDQVDNSPSLRKMWGEEYNSGFPDKTLRNALYQRFLDNGLTAVRLPLTLSVKNIEETYNYGHDKIPELVGISYGACEMEMGWVLAHAIKLNKPAVGIFSISDRDGERFDLDIAYNKLSPKTKEGVSNILESAVQFLIN